MKRKPGILVVEDENIVALDIQAQLESLGYDVLQIVASGEDALQALTSFTPSLILMDIMLKGQYDGIETSKMIKKKYNIPIVFLTAYSEDATLAEAKKTAPFGYLLKPFEERELHTAIEMALYRHKIESRLKESEQWLATTLMSIIDGVIATDEIGNIRFMNPIAEQLTGVLQHDVLGKSIEKVFTIVDDQDNLLYYNPIREVLKEDVSLKGNATIFLRHAGGTIVPIDYTSAPIKDEEDHIAGAVLVFRDVTERKTYEKKIFQLAYYDQLTGLPNRTQFNDQLKYIFDDAAKLDKQFALMFLDLDKFKNVNDTLGHNIGDLLLKATAKRLKNCIRKNDVICRQGGDEFTIILRDIAHKKDSIAVANKIIEKLSQPFMINKYVIQVTPSIGIALYPQDTKDIHKLMMYADSAMYKSKRNGGKKYAFFAIAKQRSFQKK